MIYLSKITLPNEKPSGWPYNIPSINSLTTMEFSSPVTFIAGDNGSGKSTLMEALAIKLKLPAIGRVDAANDASLKELRPLARMIKQSFVAKPRSKFFLRSEDFFNFVLKLSIEQAELKSELIRVDRENANRSRFAQNQARMAYAGSLNAMEGRYGSDLLSEASHGESFMRLFNDRIHPKGLYLLDEPEVPLSPLRQMALLSLVKEMSNENDCQFIIATHSPILLAMSDTTIYNMDETPPKITDWCDLESVQLYTDFFRDPKGYVRRL